MLKPFLIVHGPSMSAKSRVLKILEEKHDFKQLSESVEVMEQALRSNEAWVLDVLRGTMSAEDLAMMRRRPNVLFVFVNSAKDASGARNLDPEYRKILPVDYEIVSESGAALESEIAGFLAEIPVLIRPPWELYFIRLAFMAASRSNCRKRRVGAVIVVDDRIVSTGYNGTPSGSVNCMDGGCERCMSEGSGRALEACECLHAETNAVVEAGRQRCKGGILYVTCSPCLSCAKLIVQAGIKKVIYYHPYDPLSGAAPLLERHSIELRPVDPTTYATVSRLSNFMP